VIYRIKVRPVSTQCETKNKNIYLEQTKPTGMLKKHKQTHTATKQSYMKSQVSSVLTDPKLENRKMNMDGGCVSRVYQDTQRIQDCLGRKRSVHPNASLFSFVPILAAIVKRTIVGVLVESAAHKRAAHRSVMCNKSVSLRFDALQTCEFLERTERRIVVPVRAENFATISRETVEERFLWRFEARVCMKLVAGTDEEIGELWVRHGSCVLESFAREESPRKTVCFDPVLVDLSFLFSPFEFDPLTARTPRRNAAVEAALNCCADFCVWERCVAKSL
jgi:hypothetical protein